MYHRTLDGQLEQEQAKLEAIKRHLTSYHPAWPDWLGDSLDDVAQDCLARINRFQAGKADSFDRARIYDLALLQFCW